MMPALRSKQFQNVGDSVAYVGLELLGISPEPMQDNGTVCPRIPYSGKLSREKSFAKLKIEDFVEKTFMGPQ